MCKLSRFSAVQVLDSAKSRLTKGRSYSWPGEKSWPSRSSSLRQHKVPTMQSDSKSLGKAKYTGPRGHRKNQIHDPECVNIREK